VTQAGSLANQFRTVSSQLDNFQAQNNALMQTNIDQINSYTQNIADLNTKIAALSRGGGSQFPNELLDQRDQLLVKLSENIDVSTLTREDGSVDVFIGQGQALISGDSRSKLELTTTTTDSTRKEVMMNGFNISSQFSSGALSGSIKFRDQVLDPAQRQLGLIAAGLGKTFNEIHQSGFDLNGNAGRGDVYIRAEELIVYSNNGNQGGAIHVSIDTATINEMQPSDYRLDYKSGVYTLTRLSDNKELIFPTGNLPATVDGMNISETSMPKGSSFIIRPTFLAAKNIKAVITEPTEIAAAKSQATGDNTNALALANLENEAALLNGKTFNQTYEQLVAKVGTSTNAANVSLSAQKALYNQATEARANFAGVNLDEEAANLVKYQNAYQAASQVVAISRSLLILS
jgi:flagellar hook-associated protein 1 FlgK